MNRDGAPQLKIFQRMRKQKPLSASGQAQGVAATAQGVAAAPCYETDFSRDPLTFERLMV